MNRFLTLLGVLAALVCGGAAHAQAVNSGHVQLSFAPLTQAAAPGTTAYVALRQKIAPGWHTYWRNPGDAGDPPTIAWTLPAGWKAGATVWPLPRRLPTGPLMDYGYSGEVVQPVQILVPRGARPGPVTLTGTVSLLVCKDVCVPEQARVTLLWRVAAEPGPADPAIQRVIDEAPRPAALAAVFAKGTPVTLAVTGDLARAAGLKDVYFYPFDPTVIDHAARQRVEQGPAGLSIALAPGSAFAQGKAPAALAGVLAIGGKGYEINARPGAIPGGVSGMVVADASGSGGASSTPTGAPGGGPGMGLFLAMGSALLGGLILNLMPCVFPVLSMKALSLASHGENAAGARLQGLAFLAGVLVTFTGLAFALIAAKAAGAEVGWGFQLQSPVVVAALSLLVFLIGLNLSGVFETGLLLQRVGGAAGRTGGLVGAFLTGALAVAVAAPCTAPFMASAVPYALTQGNGAALAVFLALGLGFALPFVLIAFVPGLLRLLPRPGPWMEGLKKTLAFPMYAAAAWLLWVLMQQAGAGSVAAALAAAIVVAFAAWLYGAAQRAGAVGRPAASLYGVSLAAALAAAALVWTGVEAAPSGPAAGDVKVAGLQSEPFSPARITALQAERRPIFVDFTAAWCVTCQVNERVALSGARVRGAFAATHTVFMKADWTRRDPVIAEALAAHGRAGVPLYLVYGADGGEPKVLGQILTEDAVVEALNGAAARPA